MVITYMVITYMVITYMVITADILTLFWWSWFRYCSKYHNILEINGTKSNIDMLSIMLNALCDR